MFRSIKWGLAGLGIALAALAGCQRLTELKKSGITRSALPTLQPRPEFIVRVSPEESSRVPWWVYKGEFEQGPGFRDAEEGFASMVCIEPDLGALVQDGDHFIADTIDERMELIVDGIPRSSTTGLVRGSIVDNLKDLESREVLSTFPGFYNLCWSAPVGRGIHQVTFRFRQTSGDIQEYVWQFEIK